MSWYGNITLWCAPWSADLDLKFSLWPWGWRQHGPSHNRCGPVQVMSGRRGTLWPQFGCRNPPNLWRLFQDRSYVTVKQINKHLKINVFQCKQEIYKQGNLYNFVSQLPLKTLLYHLQKYTFVVVLYTWYSSYTITFSIYFYHYLASSSTFTPTLHHSLLLPLPCFILFSLPSTSEFPPPSCFFVLLSKQFWSPNVWSLICN